MKKIHIFAIGLVAALFVGGLAVALSPADFAVGVTGQISNGPPVRTPAVFYQDIDNFSATTTGLSVFESVPVPARLVRAEAKFTTASGYGDLYPNYRAFGASITIRGATVATLSYPDTPDVAYTVTPKYQIPTYVRACSSLTPENSTLTGTGCTDLSSTVSAGTALTFSTSGNVGFQWTTSNALCIGSASKFSGVYLNVGTANSATQVLQPTFWNATAWIRQTDKSTFFDQTMNAARTVSMNHDGYVTWRPDAGTMSAWTTKALGSTTAYWMCMSGDGAFTDAMTLTSVGILPLISAADETNLPTDKFNFTDNASAVSSSVDSSVWDLSYAPSGRAGLVKYLIGYKCPIGILGLDVVGANANNTCASGDQPNTSHFWDDAGATWTPQALTASAITTVDGTASQLIGLANDGLYWKKPIAIQGPTRFGDYTKHWMWLAPTTGTYDAVTTLNRIDVLPVAGAWCGDDITAAAGTIIKDGASLQTAMPGDRITMAVTTADAALTAGLVSIRLTWQAIAN